MVAFDALLATVGLIVRYLVPVGLMVVHLAAVRNGTVRDREAPFAPSLARDMPAAQEAALRV